MTQDIIFIKGLEIKTIIGVFAYERDHRQRVIIDLELFLDTRLAAQQDDLKATVNYANVVDAVIQWTHSQPALVETLATQIAENILKTFRVQKVKVSVCKPDILPMCQGVGITLIREAS